jgi:hypothetical protein
MKYVVAIFILAAMASAPAHADCASTVNSVVDRMMDLQMKEGLADPKMTPEMRKMAEDMVNQMKPKLKAVMTRSCIDDAWSSDALKCLEDARDMASMDRCERKLTAQQRTNVEKAMTVAMGMDSVDDAAKLACGDAASTIADLVLGLRTPPASAKAQVTRRKDAAAALIAKLAGLCASDRWSEEAVSCMKSASSLTDLVACRGRLSMNAEDHLEGAEMDAFTTSVDCAKPAARAIERMTKTDDFHRTHMTWALAESCAADWWPASSLTCVAGAKTTKALERCEAKLGTSQRADVQALMTYAMSIGEAIVDDPSLPPECKEYHAVIERLASCDKMPAQARAALRDAYRQAAVGWTNLPPEALASLATACKAGTEAVSQSAKSVCGW